MEVKYVTDQEFWDAISNAWQTHTPADCGTFSGPTGAIGHWYVVDLQGNFSQPRQAEWPPSSPQWMLLWCQRQISKAISARCHHTSGRARGAHRHPETK